MGNLKIEDLRAKYDVAWASEPTYRIRVGPHGHGGVQHDAGLIAVAAEAESVEQSACVRLIETFRSGGRWTLDGSPESVRGLRIYEALEALIAKKIPNTMVAADGTRFAQSSGTHTFGGRLRSDVTTVEECGVAGVDVTTDERLVCVLHPTHINRHEDASGRRWHGDGGTCTPFPDHTKRVLAERRAKAAPTDKGTAINRRASAGARVVEWREAVKHAKGPDQKAVAENELCKAKQEYEIALKEENDGTAAVRTKDHPV